MFVAPWVSPAARPPEEIVATVSDDEVHVAEAVRSCELPSLRIPVAKNCVANPAGTVGFAGVIERETNTGSPATSVADPQTAPSQALTVAEPAATE
jgi:hypothetical protein